MGKGIFIILGIALIGIFTLSGDVKSDDIEKELNNEKVYTSYEELDLIKGEIQISSGGFFKQDNKIVKRNEVVDLLEAEMVNQGKVYSCNITEDSDTGAKCKSINGTFEVELNITKKKNGNYPIWIEKQNKSYKEGKSKPKDKTYKKDITNIILSSSNPSKILKVKLENMKDVIHIGDKSTTIKIITNASSPNYGESYINNFSPDTNYDGTDMKIHHRGLSPNGTTPFFVNLTAIIPPDQIITEILFDFYEIDTGGINTSYNGYIMNCTFDESTVTFNNYCSGNHIAEVNQANELFKVTQVYATGNRYNITWYPAIAQLLYEKNNYHTVYFLNSIPIDRYSNPADREDANSWNIFITFDIGNTKPTNPEPIINSTNVNNQSNNNLECGFFCNDDDVGDTMTFDINWLIGNDTSGSGIVQGVKHSSYIDTSCVEDAYTKAFFDAGNITGGEIFWCEVRIYDQQSYSDWVNSTIPVVTQTVAVASDCDLGCVQVSDGCTAIVGDGCTIITK